MAEAIATTYDVRIWKIRKCTGVKSTSYEVIWKVGSRRRSRKLTTRALADSFRSDLLSAARRGEPFDQATGMPLSHRPIATGPTWWEWCLTYTAIKWPNLAPGSRRGVAEALTTATCALIADAPSKPAGKLLREAMMRWAFNVPARNSPPKGDIASAVRWLETHTGKLTSLDSPAVTRAVLDALARKLDGSFAAASTVSRKRAVFHNALALAVEHGHLAANPLTRIRWSAPKINEVLDMRSVVNPEQAQRLLDAVAAQSEPTDTEDAGGSDRSDLGRRLVAFFGCIYFAGLRPAEVLELRVGNLDLPDEEGWGRIVLSGSNPDVSPVWSDDGRRRPRQLKHRAKGATRIVPCAPPLVRLLRQHLERFPPGVGGQIFRGRNGGMITENTYGKVWKAARLAALTPTEATSPLARRPYDLRHAAVSTWLAAGVESPRVAAWAGHSVQVLHRVYAQVIAGGEDASLERVSRVLEPQASTSDGAQVPANE